MGLFGSSKDKAAKAEAIRAHKNARGELERVSKGIRTETPAYLRANRRVLETEKNVSWWRR